MLFPSAGAGRATSAPHRLSPPQRLILVVCAVATALAAARLSPPRSSHPPEEIETFASPEVSVHPSDSIARFTASWVTPLAHTVSAHSSAICALPSGDLLAVWYGGSREGASDVALFTSRLPAGTGEWTPPDRTLNRAMAEDELERMIKKLGNAVIFPDRGGGLWMIYVSVSLGGWSGSALNVKSSRDEGRTWSGSQRLTLNPFFNLSSLVRNKPIYASDGRIGLPVYHEMALKYPQMLWLIPGADGTIEDYRVRSLASEPGLLQPALVPLGGDRVLMMLRDNRDQRNLYTSFSEDNGWTWSEAEPSELPNPDAAFDALRLRDGRILLAYNHSDTDRENLRLAVSADQGRTWRTSAVLEQAVDQEYSYPNLVEDQRGRIHLIYTWQRERIKHVTFNLAWLNHNTLAQLSSAP